MSRSATFVALLALLAACDGTAPTSNAQLPIPDAPRPPRGEPPVGAPVEPVASLVAPSAQNERVDAGRKPVAKDGDVRLRS